MPGLRMAKANKLDFEKMIFAGHVIDVFDDRFFGGVSVDKDIKDFQHLFEEEYPWKEALIRAMFEQDEITLEGIIKLMAHVFGSGSHGRIVFGCDILIDNTCDPEIDHLEFKKELRFAEHIKACQQFTGFAHYKNSGNDLEGLITSMALTKEDWLEIKSEGLLHGLSEDQVLEVDNILELEVADA